MLARRALAVWVALGAIGGPVAADAATLSWKGHTWQLSSGGIAGVCQANPSNVTVDAAGYLHLKLTDNGGVWAAAELFTTDPLGFGTYQWQVDGPIDTFDKNVVLGLFPYGPAAGIGVDGTNEIDIEYSRWGEATGPNGDWTDYPASGSTIGELSYSFALGGATLSTSRFVWSSTSITDFLFGGLQPVDGTAGLIKTWTYIPQNPAANIPQQPLPVGMNLWCFNAPPSNGTPVEVVIRDFTFVAAGGAAGTGGIAAGGGSGGAAGGAAAGGSTTSASGGTTPAAGSGGIAGSTGGSSREGCSCGMAKAGDLGRSGWICMLLAWLVARRRRSSGARRSLARIGTVVVICVGCGGTGPGTKPEAPGGAGGIAATGGEGGARGMGTGGTGGSHGAGEAGRGGGAAGSSGGAGGTPWRVYTTKFPLTENPISEGGNRIDGQAVGLDWHDVSTTPGLAIGHQSGSSYTDGTALLTGSWGPTQTVEAVVHTINPKESCYQEVEMRLRSTLTAHSCTGYEISLKATKSASAYLIIVRWNGKVGDFTYLANVTGTQYGITEGDTVKATVSGNVITASINGVAVGMATDSTYTTGNPGMGFNLETGDASCIGTNGDYGFTSFTATSN